MKLNTTYVKDPMTIMDYEYDDYMSKDLTIMIHDKETDVHFQFPKYNFKTSPKFFKERLKKMLKPQVRNKVDKFVKEISGKTVGEFFRQWLESFDGDMNKEPCPQSTYQLETMFGCYLFNQGKNLIDMYLGSMEMMGMNPIHKSKLDLDEYSEYERDSMCDIGFVYMVGEDGKPNIGIQHEVPEGGKWSIVSKKGMSKTKVRKFMKKCRDRMNRTKQWNNLWGKK